VGVSELDEQHKQLFSLINELFEATETEWNSRAVLHAIEAMRDYALFHFKAEEKHMSECGYPDLENHKKVHEQFRGKIEELCSERKGRAGETFTHIIEYLYKWMTDHIISMDKQYGPIVCSHRK
jgi:hemerythrin